MTECPRKEKENTWDYILLSGAKGRLDPNSQPAPFSLRPCCSLLVNPSWKKTKGKQNTQWVKQNKESVFEWIFFLSSLGRAWDLSWKRFYRFAPPSSSPHLWAQEQDLVPSLAGSFTSSSFCGLSGSHTGHV